LDTPGDLGLPAVTVRQQLLLIVHELFAGLGGELEVRPFDYRVHRAGFLAQATVDALGHVDVIARGAARAVLARLGLDRDRLRRADRLAQLAGDAALLAVRIAAQCVLALEARAERTLLIRVVQRHLRLEEIAQRQAKPGNQLAEQHAARRAIEKS